MKTLSTFFSIILTAMSAALASPGPHGPGGEHLNEASEGHTHIDAGPRIATFNDTFELVGQVQGNELSILIDRYVTNEPVLDGKLEIRFKDIMVPARFHVDHGDYAVDDAHLLKALAAPGKHTLTFLFATGAERAVLEGTLDVADLHDHDSLAHENRDGHGPTLVVWGSGGVLIAVVLSAMAIGLARRKSSIGKK